MRELVHRFQLKRVNWKCITRGKGLNISLGIVLGHHVFFHLFFNSLPTIFRTIVTPLNNLHKVANVPFGLYHLQLVQFFAILIPIQYEYKMCSSVEEEE
ncbi:hypothetical protein KDAU_13940 [Dictyobacter aurantiacus]|uniref:Uncharacterized protein n=1 Tax=Dictyobacter aurantiacus TaxID=1936993 RepID=A0A401ZB22_9CHLR|nr:hypothetical protein KDAU_13940 [Dictyobacter aurantiacus]